MSDEVSEQTESRLSRWSQRKQQAREQQQLVPDQSAESDDAEVEVEPDEEPLLSDEDMPALDTIDADSDLSCFFNKGVSEKLRQAALRQLFRCPALNITDGLNDYDEDYTSFEPLGDIVTSDMRYHTERRRKLEQERLALSEDSATAEPVDSSEAADEDRDEHQDEVAQETDQGESAMSDEAPGTDNISEQVEHSTPDEDQNTNLSAHLDDPSAAKNTDET